MQQNFLIQRKAICWNFQCLGYDIINQTSRTKALKVTSNTQNFRLNLYSPGTQRLMTQYVYRIRIIIHILPKRVAPMMINPNDWSQHNKVIISRKLSSNISEQTCQPQRPRLACSTILVTREFCLNDHVRVEIFDEMIISMSRWLTQID